MTEQSALAGIDPSLLEFNDPPQILWVRVQDAINLIWRDNPKLHDIGGLSRSMVEHGYKEPAIFSARLFRVTQDEADGEPQGAFVVGNGRIEALTRLERGGDVDLPRGLAVEPETGAWVVWIIAGTDAKSQAMAQAYGVDSNLLGMMGGSMSHVDMSRVWDERAYLRLLDDLARQDALPVSMDGDDYELLKAVLEGELPGQGSTTDQSGSQDPWPEIRLRVDPETFVLYTRLMGQAEGADEVAQFRNVLLLAKDYLEQMEGAKP